MPFIIQNRRILTGASSVAITTYDSEAQALFDRMTISPDNTRKSAIDNFFTGIKGDEGLSNISDAFDCIWFSAAHDQQASRLNWVKNAHNLTEVNVPSWTVDRGYTELNGTSYLDTNYNPNTQGINYTLNNCSFGTYLRVGTIEATSIGMGIMTAGFSGSQIFQRYTGNIFYSRVNSGDLASATSTSSAGSFSAARTISTQHTEYKNGVLVNTAASNSTSVLSLNFYLLATNLDGSASNFSSNNEIAFAYTANGTINKLNLYNRVQTYLIALGAQV